MHTFLNWQNQAIALASYRHSCHRLRAGFEWMPVQLTMADHLGVLDAFWSFPQSPHLDLKLLDLEINIFFRFQFLVYLTLIHVDWVISNLRKLVLTRSKMDTVSVAVGSRLMI